MTVHGIDLGTTRSVISRTDERGEPQIIAGMSGSPTTPSAVLFTGPAEHMVGEGARIQARADPDHVCTLVKRRMGEADWRFVAHGRAWSASAVSSLIVKSLVSDAAFHGEDVRSVVITVPAYFGDEERRATMLAGSYAGVEVLDVLSEPIAAALAYGFGALDRMSHDATSDDVETVLVFDLGGGTFDATVIELADRRISVLAVEGDHQLGGADWDERIALHLSRVFCSENPSAEDPLDDSVGAQALLLAAEQVKMDLTDAERTQVTVEHDGARSTVTMTRGEVEELTAPLLRRTVDLTRSCVAEAARRGVGRVGRVLLVGGSSRMPVISRALHDELGLQPELYDPDLAVARGAALHGEKKEIERLVSQDLLTRGRLRDGATLEDAAPADLDAACTRVATAYGIPPHRVRNAVLIQVDTVVSRGFGVLAVNPLTGRLEPSWLVHRNDRLPIRISRSYGTMRADQEQIAVNVVEQQGKAESSRAEDTKILISGEITGIPPGYDEGSEVQVTFAMMFDGVLHVTAYHAEAGIPLELSAVTGATMSQSEVARERDQLGRMRRKEL